MSIAIVFTTVDSEALAQSIACTLVEERLAACVNVLAAVRSVYRWQGQIEQASEWPLMIKTRSDLLDRLFERIRALHTYEVPELIALDPSHVDHRYASWVERSCIGGE
jgi:periplasmic divalent cation tolerance protein